MMMGTTEIRLHCLKIAAQMNRRITKDDPIPTPDQLVQYARALSEYARRGEHSNGERPNADFSN